MKIEDFVSPCIQLLFQK